MIKDRTEFIDDDDDDVRDEDYGDCDDGFDNTYDNKDNDVFNLLMMIVDNTASC